MKELIIGILTIVFFSAMLKLFSWFYNKKNNEEKLNKKMNFKKINLLNDSPSYEQFEKVSRECSVLNSPVRTEGDFMDFIIENISFVDVGIENEILTLNYGEEYGK